MFSRLLIVWLLAAGALAAEIPITVVDENTLPVPGAVVTLRDSSGREAARCETDYAGRCRMAIAPGRYTLTVARQGFYQLRNASFTLSTATELVLHHVQEVKETVNVVESAPAVDPQRTADTRTLGSQEIINVPYPTSRDIRNVLPLIPGVVRGPFGEAHVAGAEIYQTEYLFDGFNVSQPATGFVQLRFSADAVRSIDVDSSRYPAQFGPASGGLVAFTSNMADDHFRFSATNFVPSVQLKKGLNFDKWVPRATFSGPLAKGRAWFLLAPEFEYDNNIVKELPDGADRNRVWRGSNLLKLQYNPTRNDALTGDVLLNFRRSTYDALSVLNPLSATTNNRYFAHFVSLREQHVFAGGAMLEIGGASSNFFNHVLPQGTEAYQITPDGVRGNFFENLRTSAGRTQGMINLYLPPLEIAGRHEFRIGVNGEQRSYDNRVARSPMEILRADGSLDSRITFTGPAKYGVSGAVVSGYAQDRWSWRDRLVLEAGLRIERDHLARGVSYSPRVAGTLMLARGTKVAAGIGLFHDPINLEIVSRSYAGERTATFFSSDPSVAPRPPADTAFHIGPGGLLSPASLNYSVELDQQLPWATTFSAEYLVRDARDGLTYLNLSANPFAGDYLLGNRRRDRYRSLLFSAHHRLRNDHEVMVSYQHATAHSNAVLDFTLDNPFFSPQQGGPLAWDTPHRLLSWGWLPVPRTRRWDLAYVLDWHTGIPFSVVSAEQQVVGAANSYRFPSFFSLDLFAEYRFGAIGRNWALRGGFENITAHRNPGIVFNNAGSSNFLSFSQFEGRAFTVRIRFLGRK